MPYYKEAELQKTITELERHKAELQDNNAYNAEVKQEEVILNNGVFIPPTNMTVNYLQNENEMLHYSPQVII